MKRLLLALLLTVTVAQAQSILRNTFTTNTAPGFSLSGSNLVVPGSLNAFALTVTNTFKLLGADANSLAVFGNLHNLNGLGNALGVLTNDGAGGMGFSTNIAQTIVVSNLITTNLTVLNSLTVSNITVTNVTVQNNLTVSNLFTVNGNHNTLIVTNSLTLQTIKTNVLATTSSGLITNVNYGSGISWDPATLTLSASGGGSSALTFNALAYSGTNVTVDCSLGDTNGAAYKLTLTNTTWFTLPSNVPTTAKGLQVWFIQPSTGLVAVAWSNVWKFPGGVQPIVDTNANAVTLVTFAVDPFTNRVNFVGITPQLQ